MKHATALTLFLALTASGVQAESRTEHGRRIVDECIAALGGPKFLAMNERVEQGRAYSFYREQLSGLNVARIYTQYLTPKGPADLAVREREVFGKKQDSGVLFTENGAWELTFRGARPLATERFARYRETTVRNILYILRQRINEAGLTFDYQGADVWSNSPVDVVNVSDSENRVTKVYFDQITHLPIRQSFSRKNTETNEKDEEVTVFSKYRDIGNGVLWPFTILRERNGEKTFEIFSEEVSANKPLSGNLFALPAKAPVLKPE